MRNSPLLLSVFLLLSACSYVAPGVRGSGNMAEETRDVGEFKALEVHGKAEVFVSQGPYQPIHIEAEDNILEILKTEVKSNGELKVWTEKRVGRSKPIVLHVQVPSYEWIDASGAVDIQSENRLTGDKLRISVSGAGDIDCDVEVNQLNTSISGAGNANFRGSAREHVFDASGAGDLHAYDLRTEDTEVSISGAGSARVYATGKLSASISGAGTVRYKGSPQVSKSVSGAGSISPAEDS